MINQLWFGRARAMLLHSHNAQYGTEARTRVYFDFDVTLTESGIRTVPGRAQYFSRISV
jgi:hypothetical protein